MESWYVVKTKLNSEFYADKNLLNQNFQTYCPKTYLIKKINNAYKKIIKPLFPGYIFVNLDINNRRWLPINSTYGVIKILSNNSIPISLPSKIIEELMQFEDEQGIINIQNECNINKGDKVVISKGIFKGYDAIFEENLSGKSKVKILLDLMGRSLGLELNKGSIINKNCL